jgi:hypothetical protein
MKSGRGLGKLVIDLACTDKVGSVKPAEIDSVLFVSVKREVRDGQCLSPHASFFDSVLPRPDEWPLSRTLQTTPLSSNQRATALRDHRL